MTNTINMMENGEKNVHESVGSTSTDNITTSSTTLSVEQSTVTSSAEQLSDPTHLSVESVKLGLGINSGGNGSPEEGLGDKKQPEPSTRSHNNTYKATTHNANGGACKVITQVPITSSTHPVKSNANTMASEKDSGDFKIATRNHSDLMTVRCHDSLYNITAPKATGEASKILTQEPFAISALPSNSPYNATTHEANGGACKIITEESSAISAPSINMDPYSVTTHAITMEFIKQKSIAHQNRLIATYHAQGKPTTTSNTLPPNINPYNQTTHTPLPSSTTDTSTPTQHEYQPQFIAWLYETSNTKLSFSEWYEKQYWETKKEAKST